MDVVFLRPPLPLTGPGDASPSEATAYAAAAAAAAGSGSGDGAQSEPGHPLAGGGGELEAASWLLDDPDLEVACEVAGSLADANTGLVFAWAGAKTAEAVDRWATTARFPPPGDDQAAFRQRLVRLPPLPPPTLACLPPHLYRLRCECAATTAAGPCDSSVVAVHCTEVANKTQSLRDAGLWAPALTGHGDCRYGVSDEWLSKNTKKAGRLGARGRA